MEKLSELIKGRLANHNLSESAKSAEVIRKANLLMAEKFNCERPGAKAYRLSDGILFIATENAVWSQEVWGVQSSILKSLKKSFGETVIKKIITKSLTIE
jgi:hypothetical protein